VRVKIKRFDRDLPLPGYKSEKAAGADLYTRETVSIEPGKVGIIALNIAMEIPPGYFVLVAPRGSTHKLGIVMVDSVGIIDEDFCGDNDEYVFPALNFTDRTVVIEKGTRIAQMLLFKNEKLEFTETEKLENPDRGKLGSTGMK
jgi:dUTP pyrophosphatase